MSHTGHRGAMGWDGSTSNETIEVIQLRNKLYNAMCKMMGSEYTDPAFTGLDVWISKLVKMDREPR